VRPDYLLAYSQLARALKQSERYRDAYRAYETVLTLEPRTGRELGAYDDALYQLAALDISMGAFERAATTLRTLLEASPEHPHAHYAYAQVLLHAGRHEEARRELERHMSIRAGMKSSAPVATGEVPRGER
jgi:tetratricopeptide (TPR) repeat protein